MRHSTISGSLSMLLTLIAASNLFSLVIFPDYVIKFEHMLFSLIIAVYALFYISKNWEKKRHILSHFDFIFYFFLLILLSFINAKVINDQTVDLTFRITYAWLEYSFIYVLLAKKVRFEDIYIACSIFAFIRLTLFLYTILTGNYIFQTVVGEDDLEGARGIMRVRVPGMMITYFWGFWSLGKYLSSEKKIYLLFFLITAIQSLLEVSRQHIFVYIILSSLLLLYRLSIFKKILFVGFLVSLFTFALPHIKIYQALVEVTETQEYKTNGFKDDIRLQATKFYIEQFPQSNYTRVMGNGLYHSESEYGRRVFYVMKNFGFILADIGFVGIYIYFGIVGLIFYAYLLYRTIKVPIHSEYSSLKYFVYFLFLTNIFSNSFQGSTIILPITLYIIYSSYLKKKYLHNKIDLSKLSVLHNTGSNAITM